MAEIKIGVSYIEHSCATTANGLCPPELMSRPFPGPAVRDSLLMACVCEPDLTSSIDKAQEVQKACS
ncbi:uncharacterized protein Dyak_GE28483, isoform A [Drosophila yakuba]|uniref:Uncharacterized protein, isoform A n=1 Tax=Drosophila yakuba TaxID=7245 RepID=A0A0R1EDY6_DROYA|nr:uncharacterized protein Dyak_GE28483, isoform A [Drosophila yakuba]